MVAHFPVVLSIEQAADYLRVGVAEIRYLIKKRKIGYYDNPRGGRTVGARHVAEYLSFIDPASPDDRPSIDDMVRGIEAWVEASEGRDMPKALPSNIAPRGLTRDQVAMYLNLPPRVFDELVKQGLYPGPLPGGIYDRKAIDAAMDRLSGLVDRSNLEWEAEEARRAIQPAIDEMNARRKTR